MQIKVITDVSDAEYVKKFVDDKLKRNRFLVADRYKRNVEYNPEFEPASEHELWQSHIVGILTTQQRSGPGSNLNKFLEITPFPLSLEACRSYSSVYDRAYAILDSATGIRATKRRAEAIAYNFALLEGGEWSNLRQWHDILLDQRRQRPNGEHREKEEAAATYAMKFKQLGPKQSRNFWQMLGLTRYVCVLDTRVLGWLKDGLGLDSPLITGKALSDYDYYDYISNLLNDLCEQAGVLPCMLDAAAFDDPDEKAGREWD